MTDSSGSSKDENTLPAGVRGRQEAGRKGQGRPGRQGRVRDGGRLDVGQRLRFVSKLSAEKTSENLEWQMIRQMYFQISNYHEFRGQNLLGKGSLGAGVDGAPDLVARPEPGAVLARLEDDAGKVTAEDERQIGGRRGRTGLTLSDRPQFGEHLPPVAAAHLQVQRVDTGRSDLDQNVVGVGDLQRNRRS